jgi:hypothetical protein
MDIHLLSYYIGIFIVFFSHIFLLIYNKSYKIITYHAYLNIIGAFLIAYYFMNKEKFIKF